LKKQITRPLDKFFNRQKFQQNYQKVLAKIKERSVLTPVLISFSVLLLAGFYQAFFVLFLKDVCH